jgi:hypothetical protein
MSQKKFNFTILISLLLLIFILYCGCESEKKSSTIALWTFDEQIGIYPSCVLSDVSENDFPLVIGPGGQIVKGKFGNALEPLEQPKIIIPESKSTLFGLAPIPAGSGRTVEPMNWYNANFCALMTSGENHLRKEVGFKQPTKSKLNLGDFNWTVEFWCYITGKTDQDGTVFEIGTGPRGENNLITRLTLDADLQHFTLYNYPSGTLVKLHTKLILNQWQHVAFVYHALEKQLKHYIHGKLQRLPEKSEIQVLPAGDEDYLSIGRDGIWQRPLQGKIDELRFSNKIVYQSEFNVPESFSYLYDGSHTKPNLESGEALLFIKDSLLLPINLGGRKHLFLDDIFLEIANNVQFNVNPPRKAEIVIQNIQGSFRKHLNVIEDESGLLRIYNSVDDDYLAVRTSKDGNHWDTPVLPGGTYKDHTNIVIHEPTGMGIVFIDPNAPANEKWKYLSGFHSRGVFIYTSADGYTFSRKKTAVLPFWAGSQSNIFYDDQQQKYISYHRADFARGVGQATQREFVMTETRDLILPWPFRPSNQKEGLELAEKRRIKDTLPFYLDNGLLTPGGFAFEYPNVFKPTDDFDPIDTDIYVPKALKYPWAPDVYLAFPVVYFHYKKSSPLSRTILGDLRYNRGSGPLETQLAVSRDAKHWQRYPRPAYVGIGEHAGRDVHTVYIAQGMIRRGNEIWQYYFGETQYHSSHFQDPGGRGVYRLVQRLDGFVSIDSPYELEGMIITKPFIYRGNRLHVNIDTDAAGYAQIGFLDEKGESIPGWNVEDCIYVNGDFTEYEVEWIKKRAKLQTEVSSEEKEWDHVSEGVEISADVSALEGRIVRLIFKMRGSKLYAFQFVDSGSVQY